MLLPQSKAIDQISVFYYSLLCHYERLSQVTTHIFDYASVYGVHWKETDIIYSVANVMVLPQSKVIY